MSYKDVFLKLFNANKPPEDDDEFNDVWSLFHKDNFSVDESFIDQDIFSEEQNDFFKGSRQNKKSLKI